MAIIVDAHFKHITLSAVFQDGSAALALEPYCRSEAGVRYRDVCICLNWCSVKLQRHIVSNLSVVERASDKEVLILSQIALTYILVKLDVDIIGRCQNTSVGISLAQQLRTAGVANHLLLGSGTYYFLVAKYSHRLSGHNIVAIDFG